MTNKKPIFFAVFVGLTFILVVVYFFISNIKQPKPSSTQANPETSPSSLNVPMEQDYSNLNKLVPGKATLEDVERINGKPNSVKKDAERTFLYYITPLEGFTNAVIIDKGVVSYSVENVFGSYRGTVQSFKSSYGKADIYLYGVDGYFWHIYLDEGFAIEADRTDILTVVYFIPQAKESFMATLAKELKLLETPPEME